MSLKLDLGLGVNSGNGVRADYALELNGTDEYLSIALPNNELLASAGVTDFYSSGSAIAGWSSAGTINWAGTTLEKTYTNTITSSSGTLYKTITSIVVGQKYKLKLRYQSTTPFIVTSSGVQILSAPATSEWNTVSVVFTATSQAIQFYPTGAWILDYASVKRDLGFDLNRDQEQILHSKNWDFERTLGTELASGTVTIGSKYVVTAGTVEGNAIGTEFLAVTNATTLDASNKVKPIPSLATGTFVNKSGAAYDTFTGASATGFTAVEDTTLGRAVAYQTFGFQSGKRYRFSYTITVNAFSFGIGLFIGDANVGTQQIVNHAATGTSTVTYDVTANAAHGYYGFRVEAGQTADFVVSGFHFYEIPEWTATGNHTASLSILDKSGTTGQSMLISASGAGDSGSNYVSLPSANIESVVSGKKYTLEGFARLDASSLGYGSDLFSSISNSVAHPYETLTASGNNITSAINTTGNGDVYINIGAVTIGEIVKVTFNFTLNSGTMPIVMIRQTVVNIAGTNSSQITPTNGTNTIYFNIINFSSNPNYLCFQSLSITNDFSVSDIVITKSTAIAPITLTAKLGTKSVTSSALSIIAGTFTKFVLNFEATASEQSQDLKLYLSGAGSVFVDKLSLTQKYDVVYIPMNKVNDTSAYYTIFGKYIGTDGGFNGDYLWYNNTTGKLEYFASDGSGISSGRSILTTSGLTPATWNKITVVSKFDEIKIYRNGVELASSALTNQFGKVIVNQALGIAGFTVGTVYPFKGQISHIQIWRFENISQSTFNSAITGLQYPTGGGSEEVLRLTFQSGVNITECLKDYSPKGHTVTGVNVDITNRKRVTS